MIGSATTESIVQPAGTDLAVIALRLVVAVLLAAAIGLDREVRGRSAGLRTHMMVGLGSAAFGLLATRILPLVSASGEVITTLDPIRIIAAVIGGVGFLGAGAIIQTGSGVRGLTTAAGLWVTASIGLATGLGMYLLAAVITLLGFVIVSIVRLAEPDEETTGC